MFRTIMALLVALVVAVLIGAFQVVGVAFQDLVDLLQAPNAPDNLMTLGGTIFFGILKPYTSAMGGSYSPLVALGVAGFIAGLISKSGVRMLFVSIIALVLFFLGYFILYAGGGYTDFNAMIATVQTMVIDIGVAFGLLFIPGIIGASLTAEDY